MTLFDLLHAFLLAFATKSLIIGSDFNIVTFATRPKEYWSWYRSRQTFQQHVDVNKLIHSMFEQFKKVMEFKLTEKEK